MKHAVISDVHGNLEALTAVLEDIDSQGVTDIVCLGDLVGYGADPNECVSKIRSRARTSVAGNHDHAAVGKLGLEFFNSAARRAATWTERVLTGENKRYLSELPLTFEMKEGALLVHSSPSSPGQWAYIFHPGQAAGEFHSFAQTVCFFGHTHQPAVYTDNAGFHCGDALGEFRMGAGTRYLVNVGSVGQPRDGNPKAAYCIFDSEDLVLSLRRVEYDVELSGMKIVRNDLPRALAERLPLGL